MRSIKNYLIMFLAVTLFIFNSCQESDEFIEPEEPNVIRTYAPEIATDQVMFKGSLLHAKGAIEYGFMWYEMPEDGQEFDEVHRLVVGVGNVDGNFEQVMSALPKGVNLVVCAFVDFQDDFSQIVNAIGDEVDFVYD